MIQLGIKIAKQIWVPILWTSIIIVLLCLPGNNLQSVPKWWKFPGYDKVVHFIMFASFVTIWLLHFDRIRISRPAIWKKRIITITSIGILLGVGTEYIQKYFVANRSFDVYDIYADISGAVLAGFYFLVRRNS